jgi:hypothetical protein
MSSNINWTVFQKKERDFRVNKIILLIARGYLNRYNKSLHVYLLLLVVITITEKLVLSAVAQRIIVKYVTKENVKPADILIRLRAQFRDETLSRIQMYDWTKSFEEGRTEIENTRRLQLLQGNYGQHFFGTLKSSCSSTSW